MPLVGYMIGEALFRELKTICRIGGLVAAWLLYLWLSCSTIQPIAAEAVVLGAERQWANRGTGSKIWGRQMFRRIIRRVVSVYHVRPVIWLCLSPRPWRERDGSCAVIWPVVILYPGEEAVDAMSGMARAARVEMAALHFMFTGGDGIGLW